MKSYVGFVKRDSLAAPRDEINSAHRRRQVLIARARAMSSGGARAADRDMGERSHVGEGPTTLLEEAPQRAVGHASRHGYVLTFFIDTRIEI